MPILSKWSALCEYVGCGKRTAQKFVYDHGLPCRRWPTGGRLFWMTDEVDEWMKTHGELVEKWTGKKRLRKRQDEFF